MDRIPIARYQPGLIPPWTRCRLPCHCHEALSGEPLSACLVDGSRDCPFAGAEQRVLRLLTLWLALYMAMPDCAHAGGRLWTPSWTDFCSF